MSLKRYTSIFCLCLLLGSSSVHAQLDLELLEDSPTPSPLPEGQEYSIEIEQLTPSEIRNEALDQAEQREFARQGFVVRSGEQLTAMSIEKTQLSFTSFRTDPIQEASTQLVVRSNLNHANQLLMDTISQLSSGTNPIPPTSCDPDYPCTKGRATPWNDTDSVGWGYSLRGERVPSDYEQGRAYKPPQTEHTSLMTFRHREAQERLIMNWKIVTSDAPDGIYSGVIRLIALPI